MVGNILLIHTRPIVIVHATPLHKVIYVPCGSIQASYIVIIYNIKIPILLVHTGDIRGNIQPININTGNGQSNIILMVIYNR